MSVDFDFVECEFGCQVFNVIFDYNCVYICVVLVGIKNVVR